MYQKINSKSQFLELFFSLKEQENRNFINFIKKADSLGGEILKVITLVNKNKSKEVDLIKLKIHETLYPGKTYKDVQIRLLFSNCLAVLKSFLLQEKSASTKYQEEIAYLQFLQSRKLDRLFGIQLSHLEKLFETNTHWDEQKYQSKYLVEYEKFRFESSKNRFNNSSFSQLVKYFETSILIQKLKIYLEHLSFVHFSTGKHYYNELEDDINKALEQDWSQVPEVQIYIQAVKLFLNFEEDDNFYSFLKLLKSNTPYMDMNTSKELYSIALNYCIRKINLDIIPYFDETLSLYDHGVEQTWILENGYMNQVTYKNIISLCIKMREFKKAEVVLNKYKPLVRKNEQESIYQFNHARILKEKGEVREALLLLNTNRYKDPLIELHARVEIIKIYFELKEENLLNNQIMSTRKFLMRSDIFGYHRDYYLNFLKYTLEVFNQSLVSLQSAKKMSLLKALRQEDQIIERNWLLGKVI